MTGEYFAEFKTGVNNAWKVVLGNWVAFSGVPPVVLAGSIPTVPFRVAIITEAIAGHTDVAGIVKVNDEDLTFIPNWTYQAFAIGLLVLFVFAYGTYRIARTGDELRLRQRDLARLLAHEKPPRVCSQ